jgi:hypothetical protein
MKLAQDSAPRFARTLTPCPSPTGRGERVKVRKQKRGEGLRPSPRVRYALPFKSAAMDGRFLIFAIKDERTNYAARLAFAFSAMAPNALMSCTAMSASTLRSTVIPALARPLIRRL